MEAKERSKKYKSKPKKGEHEVGKVGTDKIINEPGFQYYEQPLVGTNYHIFRIPNEQLIGTVIGEGIKNVRRNKSYPIRLEEKCQGVCDCQAGNVVEIFATKHLVEKLRRCVGYKVRIVYIGRRHQYRGFYEKIFRVYKFTKPGEETLIGKSVG